MADIELVIKIPVHLYKLLKEFPSDSNEGSIENVLTIAVEHGTPLPKGHGDLKDVSKLHYVTMLSQNLKTGKHKHITVVRAKEINDAPTIIEADRSEEDGNDNH